MLCKLNSRKEICIKSTVFEMNLLCFNFGYGGLNFHFKKRLRKNNLVSKRLIKGILRDIGFSHFSNAMTQAEVNLA